MTHTPAAWPATRDEALRRLTAFVPRAGRAYAATRNEDRGPSDRSNVSVLSPYLRHRLITEETVLRAVDARHGDAAFKFRAEVFWRTYWKGWLETHPGVWTDYLRDVADAHAALESDADLASRYGCAIAGETGIGPFDVWNAELLERGYVHNHARMWYASMWMHTLRLPWVLGADHFMRHLLDGDPASNTLSWRWVAGLHTRGKTYLARRANIVRATGGRLDPGPALASHATALREATVPEFVPLPPAPPPTPAQDVLLIVHDDDLDAASLPIGGARVRGILALDAIDGRSPAPMGRLPRAFTSAAIADALQTAAAHFGAPTGHYRSDTLVAAARDLGIDDIVWPEPLCGPVRDAAADVTARCAAAGIAVHPVRRRWDAVAFPHASRGYFGLGAKIPAILAELGIGAP